MLLLIISSSRLVSSRLLWALSQTSAKRFVKQPEKLKIVQHFWSHFMHFCLLVGQCSSNVCSVSALGLYLIFGHLVDRRKIIILVCLFAVCQGSVHIHTIQHHGNLFAGSSLQSACFKQVGSLVLPLKKAAGLFSCEFNKQRNKGFSVA